MPIIIAETLFVLAAVVMPAVAVVGALTVVVGSAVRRLRRSRSAGGGRAHRELGLSGS